MPNPVHRPAAARAAVTLLAILLSAIWTTPGRAFRRCCAVRFWRRRRSCHCRRRRSAICSSPVLASSFDAAPDGEVTSDDAYAMLRIQEQSRAGSDLRAEVTDALAARPFVEVPFNEDGDEPVARYLALPPSIPANASRRLFPRRHFLQPCGGPFVLDLEVTAHVGIKLLTDHLLAFEALSLLLLAAMHGAIVLSRRKARVMTPIELRVVLTCISSK